MDIPRPAQPKGRKRLIYGAVALAAVVTVTVALSRLEPAAPSVDAGTVFLDTVRQGPMVREVRGPGTLVPEQMRPLEAAVLLDQRNRIIRLCTSDQCRASGLDCAMMICEQDPRAVRGTRIGLG